MGDDGGETMYRTSVGRNLVYVVSSQSDVDIAQIPLVSCTVSEPAPIKYFLRFAIS
jgi:hypothetical protein